MKKLVSSIKNNGYLETIKKALNRILKVLGLLESETYFFEKKIDDIRSQSTKEQIYNDNISIKFLDYKEKTQFEYMKYYEFLDTESLLNSEMSKVLIALHKDKIIGFACIHRGSNHLIHDLGYWNLSEDEAWIGPTYVIKNYRNRGIHKDLLNRAIEYSYFMGIKKYIQRLILKILLRSRVFVRLALN